MTRTSRSILVDRCVWVLLGASTATLLIGCSGEVRTRVMHFFFEYPPETEAVVEPVTGISSSGPSSSEPELPDPIEITPRFASRHPPFIKRECQQCHIRGMGQAPRPDFMAKCQECHQPLFEYHRFGHAPVVAGECRICHFMHVSEQTKLLKKPQSILCTQCHPAQHTDKALSSYHQGIETMDCTVCHDPHYADNQLLLKPEEDRQRARRELESARADHGVIE